mmetsp:Transcript_19206/g.29188  ORF Transcript_19206/g.29188 Transcript_19206/m.29188 type:complete len:237 (+) Transcript_19206:344-1054(+)|eukprot:CAMPEP_0118724546 /NCGR_PEP_ID=MMETSP0800-20121206/32638_1 /TAXON_ID=210618 ORGANISM="Striatella unipunctata, Strain CCMP2910" /NCGR_SAMPLE_ID=MMETSP0800 /ASSEMBLY_ACC=CAM_ASM_000638 /LENGTH=236 /DNA_ID=CAMNT_0006633133 /DNA_START=328 /DNA_END=1038 /DNA_ORIENTATION=-
MSNENAQESTEQTDKVAGSEDGRNREDSTARDDKESGIPSKPLKRKAGPSEKPYRKSQRKNTRSSPGRTEVAHKKKPAAEDEVARLENATLNLISKVEDPIEESLILAASAGAPEQVAKKAGREEGVGNLYKPKASSKRILFEDSDEEDQRPILSNVPDKASLKSTRRPIKSNDVLPLIRGRRRGFTDKEKTAIKLGVEKFGVGKWSQIKSYYSVELRDRTSVNIKVSKNNLEISL